MKDKLFTAVVSLALVVGLFGVLPAPRALAATTYTWNQTGSASWVTAENWTPTRTTPASDDILVIDGSVTATPTLTNVTTETIGQLRIINNAIATFTATSSATLTVSGGAGIDLEIDAGSSLTLSGSNAILISLSSGVTGSVSGSMTVAGGAHRLTAIGADAITMNSGATFTTGSSFSGSAFGNATGSASSIVFAAGSTYTHNAGSNPFALTAPSSVVVFQPGSTAIFRTNTGYSASGRTYANLTVQNNTALNGTGASDFQFQTLTVESGSSFTHSGSSAATVTIRGDISSAGIGNVSLTSGTGGIQVIGGTTQTFGGGGGSGSITFASAVTVASGTTLAAARTLTTDGPTTINGSFQLNSGGWATGSGTWNYASGATLIFNSSGSYAVNDSDVFWPATNGPQNVTVQTGGLTMNMARTVGGTFQTSAGVTNGNNLTLNGTARINTGGFFTGSPVYGAASTLVYNPGGSYNIGAEWVSGGTVGSGVPKNVTIQNSTAVALPNGAGSRTVNGDLTIGSGSSLSLGGNIGDDLNVGGNWVNDGGFTANNRTVTFNGSAAQTIGGSADTAFAYLAIDNPAGVALARSASAANELALTNGRLTLGNYDLTLASSASVSGTPDATKMIVTDVDGSQTGKLCKVWGSGAFTYPIGDNRGTAEYSPVTFTPASPSGLTVCFRVVDDKNSNVPPQVTTDYLTRYWVGETMAGSFGNTTSATFTFIDNASDVVGSASAMLPKKWDGSYPWTETSPMAVPTFTYGGLASLSQFTAFKSGVLAVTLAEFSAVQQGDAVLVTWETAMELDNRGFNLYRGTSPDGWDRRLNEYLIPSQGQGSPVGFTYTWQDRADLTPDTTYYYWLEDVDIHGATTLHGPVSVDYVGPTAVALSSMSASPAGAAASLPGALLALLAAPLAGAAWALRRRP